MYSSCRGQTSYILLGFPKYTLLIDLVFCCLVPADSVTSHRQLWPDSSQMEHPLASLQPSATHQTSRFGPAERGIWQHTKMAVECFGFREKGAELRSTLTGAKGDVRAERHMVSILSWMVLPSLSFNAPFFLLSVKASGQTSRTSVYFMILWQNRLLTLKGERACACVYKCITPSWALDMCVLLAVHVWKAKRWNPSTANDPNTVNPNRCFTVLNAVTWRPDAQRPIPFLPHR